MPNGLALCRLHHSAYDADLLGIRPDYRVEVSGALLEAHDGPTLEHALKSFDGRAIHVPRATALQPDRGFLEERFAKFKRAS